MALYRIVNNNGTLEKESLTGVGGLPLGAIISYYGSSVPDGYLPCDGSTFDETTYPALYMLLGSNTLPVVMEEGAKAVTFSNSTNQSATAAMTYPFTLKHASKYKLMVTKVNIRDGQGLATQNEIDLTQYTTRGVVYATWADSSYSNSVGFYVTYDPDTDEAVFDTYANASPYSVTFFEAFDGYNGYTPTYKAIKAVSGYEASQESTLFNDLKDYMRNQDVLSDLESWTPSTTAQTMAYDGYLYLHTTTRKVVYVDLNGTRLGGFLAESDWPAADGYVVNFQKGDTIAVSQTSDLVVWARYYKLRDYTARN